MSGAAERVAKMLAVELSSPPEQIDPNTWAQPFVYRNPADIPPRRWLYRPHLIRGFVSLTVSPGGVGKSTLTLCEGLALASGRPLLGITPEERTRVWCWNGEDPADETERRIQAAMIHHQLQPFDLEGWLFTGSGRDADLIIAEQERSGIVIAVPVVEALIEFIRENEIGMVVIDPFVSSHRVTENDNGAIDRVVKTWARIADRTGCAVELVHHTRKTGGAEVTVEDGRGASALLAAARHARTLRTMSDQEADSLGVERPERQAYVRIDSGKANLSPPASGAVWFRLANVHLPNGDYVQAAAPWMPPNPFDGVTAADLLNVQRAVAAGRGEANEGWRASRQTEEAWVGHAVASALGLDLERQRDAARARELIRTWVGSGNLVKVTRSINPKGKTAPFVEVGRWAEP